ncbi:MAG TPA: type II toxin-antitoxin system RelE/ParE family toxin [Pirellulales bacterium]|nr:type II toxin-antitoxin system RelE/ParE family toxin [Pirellulales bacterium]
MPKKHRVEITAAAERDLREIRDYIALDKPAAAQQWVKRIAKQIRSLKANAAAARGHSGSAGNRRRISTHAFRALSDDLPGRERASDCCACDSRSTLAGSIFFAWFGKSLKQIRSSSSRG